MLPEIELVRARTDRVISPEEISKQLRHKSVATIKVNLGRAVNQGKIIRLGIGEYAHPDYRSSVPSPSSKTQPKLSQSDWKQSRHASLIYVVLYAFENVKPGYHPELARDIYDIIKERFEEEALEEFCKLLSRAWKEAAEIAPRKFGELATVTPREIKKVILEGGQY